MNLEDPKVILIRYKYNKERVENGGSRLLLDSLSRLEQQYIVATEGQQIPRGLLYLGNRVRK